MLQVKYARAKSPFILMEQITWSVPSDNTFSLISAVFARSLIEVTLNNEFPPDNCVLSLFFEEILKTGLDEWSF
jgi:hypothetical protein